MLEGILGYPVNDKDIFAHEENYVEFQCKLSNDKTVCMEVKGTKTKNLFQRQNYEKKEQSTPMKQLWGYMSNAEFGICTNYKLFILVIREYGTNVYHQFDFETIAKNESKLKEFVCIFSKQHLENNFITNLHEQSIIEEKEITDEFYKLFHTTRLMLIKEFEKDDVTKNMSIQIAQIFLNRLIFWFFAEDRGFISKTLFYDKIISILDTKPTEYSKSVFSGINDMFMIFDKGSHEIDVFGFNGGLFSGEIPHNIHFNDLQNKKQNSSIKQNHKLLKFIKMDENIQKIIQKYHNLNPIISNLLLMASFDFTTDINVNILGHIFEQSITDLEELQGKKESKRKKEGVYYTPEYITDYICRNTIIPYLSKSGKVTDPYDLVDEYQNDIQELEKKFKNITICDPACGSGAFLVKATDVLLEIHKAIQEYKESIGKYSGLDKWNEQSEIRDIIENNIYGVDINREAVEISRLAMFFKTASTKRKLPDLSKNILTGNSVITDINKPNAFDWNKNFPPIMESAGFDIIIGNPPYVIYQNLKSYIDYIQLPKSNTLMLEKDFKIHSYTDLVGYFFYHSLNILKQNGKIGFISSDGWMHSSYGKLLQKVILDNCVIEKMMHTVFNVFEDADIKTITILLEKKKSSTNTNVQLINVNKEDEIISGDFKNIIKPQSEFEQGNWNLYFVEDKFIPKIDMIKMHPDIGNVKIGTLTGCDSFFVLSKEIIDKYQIPDTYLKPILSKNIDSVYVVPKQATEYFFNVDESKGKLLQSEDGKKALKYIEMGEKTTITPKRGSDVTPKLIPELYNLKNKKTWYSLSLGITPPIFIARFGDKQMKLVENSGNFHSTRRNVGITPKKTKYTYALLTYLRSSFFALYLEKHGHIHGGGALEIRTTDYKNALIPDFDKISKINVEKMRKTWKRYKEDLDQKKLDNVVCDVLGFTMDEQNKIQEELQIFIKQRTENKKSE